MATVTFNLTTTAMQRLQEATDWHNQLSGESLTAKQWAILVLRQAVIGTKKEQYSREQQAQQLIDLGLQLEADIEIT